MAEPEVDAGLRNRWASLREDLVFLPTLDGMTPETHQCGLETVEFVRVRPVDEAVMVPEAPEVTTEDVRNYPEWSDAEADQQRVWALAGTAIEGSKVTRTCPDCAGSRQVTCRSCGGGGQENCHWCGGSGRRSCSSCGGSGSRSVTRTTTNPDGTTSTTTDHERCMSCGGDGSDRCSSCFGSGRVTCSTCGGDGRVACQTCSPRGTVDIFTRRSFVGSEVSLHVLPVEIPEYPERVSLSREHVEVHAREAAVPFDAVADRALLQERGIASADSRIFFVRKATATVHMLREERSGGLCASFIDGKPEPVMTAHWTCLDRAWSTARQRYKAFASAILWALGPVAAIGFLFAGQPLIALGAAVVALPCAYLLYHNPLQAFRMAFLDISCPQHYHTTTMRCSGCGKDLCHECVLPSVRCPNCGTVLSEAVTHLVEDGKWVPARDPAKAD